MARSEYKCAECPTTIKVMGRNRAAADSLAKWHEEQGHICGDCAAKHRDEENARAAEANKSDDLPDLLGSEAQIAWAETIRRSLIDKAQADADRAPSPELEALCLILRDRTFASWWIDNRMCDTNAIARSLESQIRAVLAPPKIQDNAQRQAEEEALLLPPCEAKSRQIAEISVIYPTIRVSFAEKRDDFNSVMRSLGFLWKRTHWAREIDEATAGDYADRMAETTHRILGAGFMVRVHNEHARAMAISGDFEPEQRRWVLTVTKGSHDGWLQIVWPREDDLFAAAKRITKAKWHGGRIVAPPSSVEEVVEFAQRYGFSVSKEAQGVLDQRRLMLSRGIIIPDLMEPEPPVRTDERIPTLEAVAGEIDDDLLDHD